MDTATQFDNKNPLAAFGLRQTPAPGATLRKVEIRDDEHTGYFDRIKDRYVWYPFNDIDFTGKMMQQPMSQAYFYRGRVAWIQPIAYKAEDNSAEALDKDGDEDLPLKTFVLTPFAQCVYLHLNYQERGLRVFEHLKNQPPELVSFIEEVILPEVPRNLIELGKYLAEQGKTNIDAADFDEKTRQLALETLTSMLEGVNQAVRYSRTLIAASEEEILTRRNKGIGKAHLDDNDRYAYIMTNRKIPAEETLEGKSGDTTNELLEKLVKAMEGRAPTLPVQKDSAEVAQLRNELATMQQQIATLLSTMPKTNAGVAVVEDDNDASNDAIQADLETRAVLPTPRKTRGRNKR